MSDSSSSEPYQASPVDADTNAQKPAKKSGGPLRIILIVIMLLMVGLLAYDFRGKSASNAAFEKVQELVDNNQEATPAEVHKLVGRKPDREIVQKEHYYEETYSWRRGRLFDTYYVTVLYAEKDEEPVLHEVEKNRPPESNSIPNPEPKELTEEQINTDGVMPEGPEFQGSDEAAPADGETATDGEASSDGEEEPADGTPQPSDGEQPTDGDAASDGEVTPEVADGE